MTTKIEVIIAVFVIVGLVYVINLVRRNKLELKYALSWIVIAILVLVLDLVPGFMGTLSDFLGIADPVNMIFFLGFAFSLVIILTLTVALSITASSVKRLNQKVGMLDKKIREMEKSE